VLAAVAALSGCLFFFAHTISRDVQELAKDTFEAIPTKLFILTLPNPLAKTIDKMHDDLRSAGTGRISLPKL
jgi:hypothetical protein